MGRILARPATGIGTSCIHTLKQQLSVCYVFYAVHTAYIFLEGLLSAAAVWTDHKTSQASLYLTAKNAPEAHDKSAPSLPVNSPKLLFCILVNSSLIGT